MDGTIITGIGYAEELFKTLSGVLPKCFLSRTQCSPQVSILPRTGKCCEIKVLLTSYDLFSATEHISFSKAFLMSQ